MGAHRRLLTSKSAPRGGYSPSPHTHTQNKNEHRQTNKTFCAISAEYRYELFILYKNGARFRPTFLALRGAFQQAEYRGLGGTKPRNKKHIFCKHDQSYINKSSINQSNSINQSSNQSNTIQSNPVQSNPIQSINQSSNQSTITQLSIFDTKSSSSMNWVAALPAN